MIPVAMPVHCDVMRPFSHDVSTRKGGVQAPEASAENGLFRFRSRMFVGDSPTGTLESRYCGQALRERIGRRRKHPRAQGFRVNAAPKGIHFQGKPSSVIGWLGLLTKGNLHAETL